MRYLLLLYDAEDSGPAPGSPEFDSMMAAYYDFDDAARKAGVMVGGEALHPTSTATTVRVRDGQTLTTDGPFAETKEQLGGYYVLDCVDLDEAARWAAKIPAALPGSVEVRPIADMSEFPDPRH